MVQERILTDPSFPTLKFQPPEFIHITLATKSELKKLSGSQLDSLVTDFRASLQELRAARQDQPFPISLLGVGRAGAGAQSVYFLVAPSREWNEVRARSALAAKDFHVTLGWTASDIHDVPKGVSALVPLAHVRDRAALQLVASAAAATVDGAAFERNGAPSEGLLSLLALSPSLDDTIRRLFEARAFAAIEALIVRAAGASDAKRLRQLCAAQISQRKYGEALETSARVPAAGGPDELFFKALHGLLAARPRENVQGCAAAAGAGAEWLASLALVVPLVNSRKQKTFLAFLDDAAAAAPVRRALPAASLLLCGTPGGSPPAPACAELPEVASDDLLVALAVLVVSLLEGDAAAARACRARFALGADFASSGARWVSVALPAAQRPVLVFAAHVLLGRTAGRPLALPAARKKAFRCFASSPYLEARFESCFELIRSAEAAARPPHADVLLLAALPYARVEELADEVLGPLPATGKYALPPSICAAVAAATPERPIVLYSPQFFAAEARAQALRGVAAAKAGVRVACVLVETPLDESRRRGALKASAVSRIQRSLAFPSVDEGFCAVARMPRAAAAQVLGSLRAPRVPLAFPCAAVLGAELPPHTLRPFPRTRHVINLGAATRDDLLYTAAERRQFLAGCICAEEKVDGANFGIFIERGEVFFHKRSRLVSFGSEAQFSRLRGFWDRHGDAIARALGHRYILYGEWLEAVHSVEYTALPDVFLAFDVYDRFYDLFLAREERERVLAHTAVSLVPVLAPPGAPLTEAGVMRLLERVSTFNAETRLEGVYMKSERGGFVIDRGKVVRPEFIQAVEGGRWEKGGIRRNGVQSSFWGA
eukprot:gnl/Chilomastix_cuspidata/4995.p1 GENE.gnl/Chilomastix_cuspidata/4995~~gnl/Chilomastix_cuspidata/4995.p1  ORF type:complete len:871 (-),score=307.42 gnl/Chilomastix_cuspidata/4995:2116-4614(-)